MKVRLERTEVNLDRTRGEVSKNIGVVGSGFGDQKVLNGRWMGCVSDRG